MVHTRFTLKIQFGVTVQRIAIWYTYMGSFSKDMHEILIDVYEYSVHCQSFRRSLMSTLRARLSRYYAACHHIIQWKYLQRDQVQHRISRRLRILCANFFICLSSFSTRVIWNSNNGRYSKKNGPQGSLLTAKRRNVFHMIGL